MILNILDIHRKIVRNIETSTGKDPPCLNNQIHCLIKKENDYIKNYTYNETMNTYYVKL